MMQVLELLRLAKRHKATLIREEIKPIAVAIAIIEVRLSERIT